MKRGFGKFESVVLLSGFLVWAGLGISDPEKAVSLESEFLRAEVQSRPFGLRILDITGKVLLETTGAIRFTTVRGQIGFTTIAVMLGKKSPFDQGVADPWTEVGELVSLEKNGDRIQVGLAQTPGSPAQVQLNIFFPTPKSVRVEAAVLGKPEVNRLEIKFQAGPEDRYYGMGERFNSAEQTGNLVYNWAQEGCMVGCENTVTTYFPVPFFLNPAGYGFLLDDTHFSEFDFAKTQSDTLAINDWNHQFNFMVFYGPDPLSVIEEYTAFTGRATVPAAWAFAPWVAATAEKLQGTANGSDHIRKVMADCRKNDIPCSAVWSEDWAWGGSGGIASQASGKFQWDLNRKRYPDYENVAKELHQDGFRFLGYFMPYLGANSELFKKVADQGVLAKDPKGGPAIFPLIYPRIAEPDLTNPSAREWWEKTFFQKAEDYGVDGWMHDFSEYTPAWAEFSDGRDGWAVHNEYPVLWSKLGREFWDRARPDGDYVFFMRAGWTGSWKYSPLMWTGDSNMSWEKNDGIPSVIAAVNSVGISGSPIAATDIAGYHCLANQPTDKELFFRWTELGAMLPVMRIHESSGCSSNWLFNSDQETILLFKKYAALHTSLFPYIYTLADEAADKGWPIVRHLMLHYPDDPGSRNEHYQFLLGDRILVAPVIVDKAREREVYFPPGEWVSWWDGKILKGPGKAVVPAPLDQIPLFIKSGKMVPIFDSQIDTLIKESRDDLNGWDDANKSIKVLFFGDGEDDYTIWDGTHFHCDSSSASCQVSNAPVKRIYTFEFK